MNRSQGLVQEKIQQVDEKKVCPTNLLPDRPTKEDAFDSHTKIAKSLAQHIKVEDGGKAIALTGGWGSGKSTVVELLEQELRDENIEVFKFDAWKHEGDNLRRAFLMRLIERFFTDDDLHHTEEKNGKKKDVKWGEYKKELGHRREKSDTQTKSTPTWFGICLGLSIPLSLYCLALIQHYGIHDWGTIEKYGRIIGAFSPVLVSIIFWIIGFFKHKPLLHLSEVETDTATSTVRLPEPSSLEFEDYYADILEKVLCMDNCMKLVIVIDDLDRVDPDLIRKIWSTMRVFIEFNGSEMISNKNIWLLVPYNPAPLRKVWENVEGDDGTNFIEKTFQSSASIPPLNSQQLKNFTMHQLGLVFLNHMDKKGDFEKVHDILSLTVFPNYQPITPRFVNNFLNNMAMFHIKYQDGFPLHIYALAVAQQREYLKIILSDDHDDVIKSLSEYKAQLDKIVGSNWQIKVTAVLEDLNIQEAKDFLLGKNILEALEGDNERDLERLSYNTRFSAMLNEVVKSNTRKWAATSEIGKIARTLNNVKGLSSKDLNVKEAWGLLWNQALNKKAWPDLYSWSGEGIGVLLSKHSPEFFAKEIVESLSNTEFDESRSVSWFEGINEVFKAIIHKLPDFKVEYSLKCNAECYLRELNNLLNNRQLSGLIKHLSPSVPVLEIQDILLRDIDGNQYTLEKAKTIKALQIANVGLEWDSIIESLDMNLIKNYDDLSTQKLGGLLFALISLRENGKEEAGKVLERKTEKIMWQLDGDDIRSTHDTLALCMQVLYENEPLKISYKPGMIGYDLFQRIGSGKLDKSVLAKQFIKLRSELDTKGDIDKYINKTGGNINAFIMEVILQIASSHSPSENFTSEEFIGTYNFIIINNHLDETRMRKLIQDMVKNAALVETVIASTPIPDNIGQKMYQKIYDTLLDLDLSTDKYIQYCRNYSIDLKK